MLKAVRDFEFAGKNYHAGETIPPYTIEADYLESLKLKGLVVDDAPQVDKKPALKK